MQSFEPQTRDVGLAPHPHRLELNSPPYALAYPAICAACGVDSDSYLAVDKVFYQDYPNTDYKRTFSIETVNVPFCSTCVAKHWVEAPVQTRSQQRVRAIFSEAGFPMFFSGLFALWGLKESLFGLFHSGRVLHFLGESAFMVGFPGLIAYGSYRMGWSNTVYARVVPQTSITRAFDFSDNIAEGFGHRYAFTMQNERFYRAFRELNTNPGKAAAVRAVLPERPPRKRPLWAMLVVGGFVSLVVLAIVASFVLG